jgi:pyruvate,orthophosphate dikinase
MFFDPERIHNMREMILASDVTARRAALAKLLPYQREDFIGIFKAMKGLPVTIRLLDPPLHEFLPPQREGPTRAGPKPGCPRQQVKNRVQQLHESQPDARPPRRPPAITYPEILEMQVRAIIEAAVEVKKAGIKVLPRS